METVMGASTIGITPALRPLGAVASGFPTVVIDSREQSPLTFTRLPSVRGTMLTGDYSFRGGEELFSVERKSIADLVACCAGDNRKRFFRELHRLRGFKFKRLVIVGAREHIEAGHYRLKISPKSVLATLAVIEVRFDTPVVFAPTPEAAAELVESWAWWVAREIVVNANDLLRGCSPNNQTISATGTVPNAANNQHP